jgi:hypothetical protein
LRRGGPAFGLEERAAAGEAFEPGAGPFWDDVAELALLVFGFPGLLLLFEVGFGLG